MAKTNRWLIDKAFNFCYGHRVHTQLLHSGLSENSPCACRHLHGHEGYLRIFLTGTQLDSQGMVTDFKNLSWLKTFIDQNLDHKFVMDRRDPLYNKMIGSHLGLIPVPATNRTERLIQDNSEKLAALGDEYFVYKAENQSQLHYEEFLGRGPLKYENESDLTGFVMINDQKIRVNDPNYICKPPVVCGFSKIDQIAGYKIDLATLPPDLSGPELEYYEGFFIVDFIPTSEALAEWMCKIVTARMNDELGTQWGHVAKVEWFETPKSRAAYVVDID